MKRKLILMGICFGILILIFARNIYKRVTDMPASSQSEKNLILRDKDMMTTDEAKRLLSYLGLSGDDFAQVFDNSELGQEKTEDSKESESYSYISFGQCLTIIKQLGQTLNIDVSALKDNLYYDIDSETPNKAMLIEEFLALFDCVVEELPEDETPVNTKKFFVLGELDKNLNDSDNKKWMATDEGKYQYQGATSYTSFYVNGILHMTNSDTKPEDSGNEKVAENNVEFNIADIVDRKVIAYVSGQNIVYIKNIVEEETILHNVFITSGKDSIISTYLHDITRDFDTKYKLSQEFENKIGDIVIQDKKIVKISIKPDTINGKVLATNDDYIEVDGYGKIDLDDNFKIYKIYDELSMEVTNSILVGYDATDFVVADGKIVAALIKEPIKAENIRVLIKTNNYDNIFHDKVTVTADKEFTVTTDDKTKTYKAGKEITFKIDDERFAKGRIRIETKSENGKIKLLTVKRSDGNPAYRGTIELSKADDGIVVINELSIEEYLYAVIPSEMPTYYGLEALKVQAICARSYAYNQLFSNDYSEYGAHIDDSVSYQVYNNIAENETSILAVKDTFGKVIEYDGAVITAYYFSTSCGHTASLNEVWGNYNQANYLVGKMQTTFDVEDGEAVYASSMTPEKLQPDFSSEDTFREFIQNKEDATYDSEFPWYRWHVTIAKEELKKSIDQSLSKRYTANPELIQTLVDGTIHDNPIYESIPISTIGNVKDIKIAKREKSGIISELILVGTENTIKVATEYNIRTLLAPVYDDVIRQDDSKASGLSMLPSAFFVIEKDDDTFTLQGGGYGHGVGMSQNGVKAMADSGKGYETIIKHYYSGVEIGYMYE